MKKILYIITQSEWGGAQKYIYDLATRLSGQFEVAVACGAGGPLVPKLKAKNIKVFVLKNLVRPINPFRDFLAFFEIYKLIKREKPDIVHTNSSKAEILGNLAARLARVPKIIFTAHGFVFNESIHRFKKKIFIWFERLAGKWADKIIAVSEFDRQSAILEKVVSPEKIVTIHHGLDLEFFRNFKTDTAAKREELGLPADAPVVGAVANFYRTKGLEYFIGAAAVISQKLPESRFIIVGEGKLRSALERQIQKFGLEEKIILTGFREDALEILATMDIFVQPSLKEGLPFSLLEAGALGRPVVATTVGGVPEIIKNNENGILISPADSQSLFQSILTLLQNKKMAETFGQKIKEKVFKDFDLSKTIQQTAELYRPLAK